MLVYRPQTRSVDTVAVLAALRAGAERLVRAGTPAHADIVDLLIACGELEAGVADALAPERDDVLPLLRAWRAAALAIGRLFVASWRQHAAALPDLTLAVAAHLGAPALGDSPPAVTVAAAEGYAHYGLYPETYLAAADAFCRDARGGSALVIGVRSIGTSLGAVVAAALEAQGWVVRADTVRPRGDPFERRVACSARLDAAWRRSADGYAVVVDEGPGLSGSSLAGVAEHLAALGFPDDRVVFFPSWPADPERLRSATARARWPRHRVYVGSFDVVWLASGRLLAPFGRGAVSDLSAGRWRGRCYDSAAAYPAAHPQHERRKFLVHGAGGPLLLEFAGLGAHGRAAQARADRLAAAGFTPPVLGLHAGFLVRPFLAGRPVGRREVGRALLVHAARYLAHLQRHFAAPRTVPVDLLIEMIRTNTREVLGAEWAARLDRLEDHAERIGVAAHGVALDGRMLLHEWLAIDGGYVKCDAVHHHDDHFFPGCEDTAWDVAATCIELAPTAAAAAQFVTEYAVRSGDRTVARRLPFHLLAYLAFRVGYTRLAAESLGDLPDGGRFAAQADRYAALLRTELARRWSDSAQLS
jgi:hypothetical protein